MRSLVWTLTCLGPVELFAYRASTTWPGLVIVFIGAGVYGILKARGGTADRLSSSVGRP